MNYFEHHIGDYDKNTAHLTACEDGIYHRMLRRYYDKERPLDSDASEVKRVVRARTREEKKAVDDVLREFFSLAADGWHHEKCDAAIAAFLAGEPEREVKKANEDNRLKRHRDLRAQLFKIITDAGEHAPWNAPMADLRSLVGRITGNDLDGNPETPTSRQPETSPVTAPATPATATHTPIPIHQTPITNHQVKEIQVSQSSKQPEPDLLGSEHQPAATPRLAGLDSCGGVLRDVDAQVLADFRALRKLQKAPITETALAGLAREAGKAGMTLNDVLRTCCENSWRGFKADWVSNLQRRGQTAGQAARTDPQSMRTGFSELNYDEDLHGRPIAHPPTGT